MVRNKSIRKNYKWRWAWITGGLIAILVMIITALVLSDTPFNRVRYLVLTDSRYFDKAILLKQTQDVYFVDETDTLHVKLPPEIAREMTTKNIMKECERSRRYCTNPIWQPYTNFHSSKMTKDGYLEIDGEFGVPSIPYDHNSRNVVCSSAWDEYKEFKHAASGICIDKQSGDFWYELRII